MRREIHVLSLEHLSSRRGATGTLSGTGECYGGPPPPPRPRHRKGRSLIQVLSPKAKAVPVCPGPQQFRRLSLGPTHPLYPQLQAVSLQPIPAPATSQHDLSPELFSASRPPYYSFHYPGVAFPRPCWRLCLLQLTPWIPCSHTSSSSSSSWPAEVVLVQLAPRDFPRPAPASEAPGLSEACTSPYTLRPTHSPAPVGPPKIPSLHSHSFTTGKDCYFT